MAAPIPHPSSDLSKNPKLLFVIERSKNANIVVYEANMSNGAFDAKNLVDVYWLDIEPSYMAKNRKDGKLDDRSELNYIEKKMAYGIHCTPSKQNSNCFDCSLVALSQRPCVVKLDAAGRPRAEMQINGTTAYIKKVFVDSTDRTLRLPKVNHIDLTGEDMTTGAIINERIIP